MVPMPLSEAAMTQIQQKKALAEIRRILMKLSQFDRFEVVEDLEANRHLLNLSDRTP